MCAAALPTHLQSTMYYSRLPCVSCSIRAGIFRNILFSSLDAKERGVIVDAMERKTFADVRRA